MLISCNESNLGALYALPPLLQAFPPTIKSLVYTTLHWQSRSGPKIYWLFLLNPTMPSPSVGHPQWSHASMKLHSRSHQGTTCQKSSRPWHKHTWDTSPTSKAQHIGRCRYSPSIHQLPHLLPNTLFTLHTVGLSPQQQSHHIKPSIICLDGLLHPYHVKVL